MCAAGQVQECSAVARLQNEPPTPNASNLVSPARRLSSRVCGAPKVAWSAFCHYTAGTIYSLSGLAMACVMLVGTREELHALGRHYGLDSVLLSPTVAWWSVAQAALVMAEARRGLAVVLARVKRRRQRHQQPGTSPSTATVLVAGQARKCQ